MSARGMALLGWLLFGLMLAIALDRNAQPQGLIEAVPIDEPDGTFVGRAHPDQPLAAPAQATIKVCEKRALPGKQHTLNPKAPPHLQRQEIVKVCLDLFRDGTRPRGPIEVIVEGKPRSIA